jgi:hypothetical protein
VGPRAGLDGYGLYRRLGGPQGRSGQVRIVQEAGWAPGPVWTVTDCTGGWVGPRAGLDRYGKSHPHQDSIPDLPARSQSQYRLSYRAHE